MRSPRHQDDPAEPEGKAVTDDQLDGDFDGELDFTPAADLDARSPRGLRASRLTRRRAASDTGADAPATRHSDSARPGSRPGSRTRSERSLGLVWRRRLSGVLILGAALVGSGLAYGALAQTSGADSTTSSADDIAAGKQLFSVSCISCHGANLEGVTDRGPSLIGIGSASVYFQVSTGRMPAMAQGAQEPRKRSDFTDEEVRQLAAYVQSIGGGPEIPEGNLRDGDIAEGGELFRLNCASCHNFAGQGAPLSEGKYAPALNEATDRQIYAIMLTGSQNMPTFGDNQLTPEQKRSIIAYVQELQASKDPGGAAIGRAGPVPEGLVIFMVGIAGLMGVIMWIGAKSS